ncbi:MAG: hypothetical protein IIU14_06195 [Ruminococcus sp.]|nr:hypothetical protein [Ruminococcus sp.]
MKTNRKKMLLSSIAMLLVALVALGSATYAWFTINKEVTASGFTGKVSSSIGLKILSESQADVDSLDTTNINDYQTTTTIAKSVGDRILSPVSMVPAANSFNAFKTEASAIDNYARDNKKAVTASTAPATYKTAGDFYVEKVYVALSGNTSGTDVTKTFKIKSLSATWGADTIASAARVVIAYHDGTNDSIIGQFAKAATNDVLEINKEKAADAALAAADTTKTDFVAMSSVDKTATHNVTSGAGDCYFTISVWLDGQDENCTTNNIRAAAVVSAIKLELKLDD